MYTNSTDKFSSHIWDFNAGHFGNHMHRVHCGHYSHVPRAGLVSEMTYYVLSGMLNPTHSLTPRADDSVSFIWLLLYFRPPTGGSQKC